MSDLLEQLPDMREDRLRAFAQHRERRVVAHRPDGLLSLPGHRGNQQANVLIGPAEEMLADTQRARVRLLLVGARGELVEMHCAAANPLRVDAPPRTTRLG